MKKVFLIFFILNSLLLRSQKVSYTGIQLIDSIPEELLPVGVSELGFILAGDNNQPVGFGYDMGGENYKIVAKLGKEYENYNGTDVKTFFRNDTIFFQSHEKYKSLYTINYYSWDSKKFSFMSTYQYDLSKQAQQSGDAALRQKDIKEAAMYYNQVEYAPVVTTAKIAYNLLGVAVILADDAYAGNSIPEAIEYFDGAFEYKINKSLLEATDQFEFNKIIMNTFEQKQADSLGSWICKYAFYLYKGGKLEKSEKIAGFLNVCYPKMIQPYLIRGDVLFDLNRQEEAKQYYDRYIGLMTSKGEAQYIEQRAKDRYQ